MKNKKYLILLVICITIILGIFLLVKDKQLDVNSEQIKDLYSYLGEVENNHCDGLNTYIEGTITNSEVPLETKLCMAYFKTQAKENGTLEITGTSKNKNKICKEGDVTFVADEKNKSCSYTKVTKEEINQSFKRLYGENIPEYKIFYINNDDACYEKGEEYLCGESETFSYSISPSAVVYRLLTKAVEKDDEIILTDYFLKVSDNKCYVANIGTTENEECTKNLVNAGDINTKFIHNNGTRYEHIFKKDSDGNYYWYQSSKK